MLLNQVTLPASDLTASKAFYLRLGLRLIVDSPHYARFESASGEGATLSLHLVDEAHSDTESGTLIYFESEQLDEWVTQLKADGLVFEQMPADQRWLWREARLRDPYGNPVCLYHAGENRRYPPWRVADSGGES